MNTTASGCRSTARRQGSVTLAQAVVVLGIAASRLFVSNRAPAAAGRTPGVTQGATSFHIN